jgi:hypothetical protein
MNDPTPADEARPNPMISVFQDAVGDPRIRCDAPGERAVSAVITDPIGLILLIAKQCRHEVVTDLAAGTVLITKP